MNENINKKIAQLTPEQRAILEKKLKEKAKAKKKITSIPVRENKDEYPMSFAQERLWFLHQLNPKSAFYNMPAMVKISGNLNLEILQNSIEKVIERHEILRSIYKFDGGPKQEILKNIKLKIKTVEIEKLHGVDEKDKIDNYAINEGSKPFDISRELPIRVSIIRVSPDENILFVTFHHIVADGWSLAVFVNEVISIYKALIKNEDISLPPLKIQYADFAKWQKDKFKRGDFNDQLRYWKKQLKNLNTKLNLPVDKPRPVNQTFNGLHKVFYIDKSIHGQLKEFAKEKQTTMFVVLLSAFKALLYRYTNQEDIAVGAPIAYRDKPELQNLIGFFINTLVFRSDFSDDLTFNKLVKQVHDLSIDAFANKDIPFEKIVESLNVKRTQESSPLFQTLFVMQNIPRKEISFENLKFKFEEVETKNVKFDITLSLEETENGITGLLGYNTDLFYEETIDDFIKRFKVLLKNVLGAPDKPLLKIKLLDEEEEKKLIDSLSIFEENGKELPLLHRMFEQSVKTYPDKDALEFFDYLQNDSFETKSFTYADLNKHANKVASFLIGKNIKPESIVAFSLNRSPEMIITILGILKSGAAYLPIDPNYPEERKLFMLKDSSADMLITSEKLISDFEKYDGKKITINELLNNNAEFLSIENPEVNISEENLAYVIYTSGSTGKPKGVGVTHRSVSNYIVNTSDEYGINNDDRILQFASISFDAAAEEIYHAFYKGATLVLRPDVIISSPKLFLDFCKNWNISVLDLPTAYWHQLVKEITDENLKLYDNLKVVIIGGERVDPLKVQQWLNHSGNHIRLYNTYGPTETTIVSLFHQISDYEKEKISFREISIGKPVKGLSAFILDANLNPVPLKFPGELCISGAGLARGYLNKPDITAKSFLSNPFAKNGGERIYRTGDRVRMQTDGSIEFLGRIDSQVKVRGFRIELNEIKNILDRHEQINESAVLTKKDKRGQNFLIAFYIPKSGATITEAGLRNYMTEKLPDYMIPTKFIELSEFPLTPHGKIDKEALIEISEEVRKEKKDFKKPENELESLLVEMWKDVLELDDIGTDCNFFEYGGDSLKAAVFINTLQKKLGKVVWVVSLFDNQTIEEYSKYLISNYSDSLTNLLGEKSEFVNKLLESNKKSKSISIDELKIKRMREMISEKSFLRKGVQLLPKKKGSKAVFILSAPRSGSTLLRVMLAGNPKIFAPPELALLLFENLSDRKKAFEGRDKGWSEGLTRAIMQIYDCDYLKAEEIINNFEKENLTVQELYYKLTDLIGDKILVDKTTTYATNIEVLERAELYFEEVKYIHITRHPSAMIQSYLNSKLNEVFGADSDFSERENAELFWIINNQNILKFFERIPPERKFTLKFENMILNPKLYMKRVSNFIGIPFDEKMIYPYDDKKLRMTDGIHPESHMVGDPKFHEHKRIDSDIAFKWQVLPDNDYLSVETIELSSRLKYFVSKKDLSAGTGKSKSNNNFQNFLIEKWKEILNVESLTVNDNFFELGGNEEKAKQFIDLLNNNFGLKIPGKALQFAPTISKFILYAKEYYGDKVRLHFGDDIENDDLVKKFEIHAGKITEKDIEEFQKIIVPVSPTKPETKLKPAVFVLSPPRSGSTLLRVMLAGNKNLFAPPELDLLSFDNMKDRKDKLSGNYSLWLESTIRVVMELQNCSAEEAEKIIEDFEEKNLSIPEVYGIFQNWLGSRIIVDKTPSYSLDTNVLLRMENWFENAKYIHLARNPYASIYSFLEANLDQNFFRFKHNYGRRELAELIWTVSHMNILNFLHDIPGERKYKLNFEELVQFPELKMKEICEFLEIEYEEEMIKPYQGNKMTDPVKASSQMVGDFKFYLHNNINTKVIDRWKKYHKTDFLNDVGIYISKQLGYKSEDLTVSGAIDEITNIDKTKKLPLSFAQQRLWFLEQLEPGLPTYNMPGTVKIKGMLDIDLFMQSITKMIERHESLRTVFPSDEGKVEQLILSKQIVDFEFDNLIDTDYETKIDLAFKKINDEAVKSFNLEDGPLARFRLYQINEDEFYFLACMHHIIADGWSIQIFVRELTDIYKSLAKGEQPKLEPLEIQYADFSVWQRKWMESNAYKQQLNYWKTKLDNAPALLELPTDYPRKPLQQQIGERISFEIHESLMNKIKRFGVNTKSTIYVILLSVFNILLSKYARTNDVLVGTPVAGRTRKELEKIIGLFVNTLVIRTKINPSNNFGELVEEVKRIIFEALSNQDIPFEKLVDELNVERSLSYSPFFQVMFVYNQSPLDSIKDEEIIIEPLPLDLKTAKFDITFVLTQLEESIKGEIEYNIGLFKRNTIERLINHFLLILEQLLENPEKKISEIEIVSRDEKQLLLSNWNNTKKEFPYPQTLHGLISEKAAEQPGHIAVELSGETITYGELEKYSNAIANALIQEGVEKNEIIGLYTYPSVETIAAILGIIKSGAAYLPLDPTYPEKRIEYMIEDSKVKKVFAQEKLRGKLDENKLKVITLDLNKFDEMFKNSSKPQREVFPEDLAYVIYTSGSTGMPKGVMQTHKGSINHAFDIDRRKPIRNGVCSLWTSLNFDVSVYEIFYPLIFGNELHIVPQEIRALNEELFEWLAVHRVVSGYLPPFVLDEYDNWLERNPGKCFLEKLMVGVEPIKLKTLSGIYDKAPNILILNGYGPTETTICSTIYEIKEKIFSDDITPIGTAMSNTRIFILDEYMNLSPIGVPGEIYIESVGEARGYLGRPDLTAEKFVPNPFSSKEGARLYRTGDLAFWQPDGNIKFAGRIDNQVKFKGFRIELGEIEENIKKHNAVDETAVIIREDQPGIKKLVAYFTLNDNEVTDGAELRKFLNEILPDYMIPSVFVKLEDMPKTPNGKIDRKNLPEPTEDNLVLSAEFVEAKNETERILTEIWKEVLKVDKIGVLDNFFELGGDSILGIQVIAKANSAGLKLSPKNLFEAPTILGLANLANKARKIVAEQGLVSGEVPLTPVQRWFFEKGFTKPEHWNQSILLEVAEKIDTDVFGNAVNEILKHHDVLRLRFIKDGEKYRQIFSEMNSSIPFEVIDLTDAGSGEIADLITEHSNKYQESLNLEKGPLFRIVYFRLGENVNDRLLIIIHHLVIDAVSWRIILEDLQTAYEQLINKVEVKLPAKTTSFKYWAEKLMDSADTKVWLDELDYWENIGKFADYVKIPVDFNNGEGLEETQEKVVVKVPAEQTEILLKDTIKKLNTNVLEVLLTSFNYALSQWDGKRKHIIGLEGHGREDLFDDVDISRTVGWFTSAFPVLMDLKDSVTVTDSLKYIKEQFRKIPKSGMGFGVLKYLSAEEKVKEVMKNIPEPEIMFNYLGIFNSDENRQGKFRKAKEKAGNDRSPVNKRPYLLDVTGNITDGELILHINYSKNYHKSSTMEELAKLFENNILQIIGTVETDESASISAVDFEDADLTDDDLDDLLMELDN